MNKTLFLFLVGFIFLSANLHAQDNNSANPDGLVDSDILFDTWEQVPTEKMTTLNIESFSGKGELTFFIYLLGIALSVFLVHSTILHSKVAYELIIIAHMFWFVCLPLLFFYWLWLRANAKAIKLKRQT